MTRLREYRSRYGLTQEEVIAEVRRRARERGDAVIPGLDQPTLSRHENGHRRPTPYYQQLYCEIYAASPADLGFRLALPAESGNHEDVNRREFLAGAAGYAATLALPEPPRLGSADLARLRQRVTYLYELDNQHGTGGAVTVRTFHRLRGLVERGGYSSTTGQGLRGLVGLTAEHAGWMAFDAGRQDDARRWWLEAMQWARLADSDAVNVLAMASMARQASYQDQPREAIDLAEAARRTAGRAATPRLTSVLLARAALGHSGARDAQSARAALRHARDRAGLARADNDPSWLDFYGPADFASHECRVAMMLGDAPASEDAARAALAMNDPVAYPRNHALYLIRLADVLARRRKLDEAAAVVKQATVAAADLDSARVKRELRGVAARLAVQG